MIARALGPVSGTAQTIRLSAGFENDLWPLPLVVDAVGTLSSVVVAAGLNSYTLVMTEPVGVGGSAGVNIAFLRPDLSAWPEASVGTVSTAVPGNLVLTFGSRGRDQTGFANSWPSVLFQLRLLKTAGANATFTAIRLIAMTRP